MAYFLQRFAQKHIQKILPRNPCGCFPDSVKERTRFCGKFIDKMDLQVTRRPGINARWSGLPEVRKELQKYLPPLAQQLHRRFSAHIDRHQPVVPMDPKPP